MSDDLVDRVAEAMTGWPLASMTDEDAEARKRPRRCRSVNTRVFTFGKRRDGSEIHMVLCVLHFAAASRALCGPWVEEQQSTADSVSGGGQ